MTNPAAADGIGGVPELRGDASVPGPGTGKSHLYIRSYLRVVIEASLLGDGK